jgi:hypothetical protein
MVSCPHPGPLPSDGSGWREATGEERCLSIRIHRNFLNLATMETSELAKVLVALGCPSEKSGAMAAQLDKRARQLAAQKGRTYEESMQHLLGLMRQGWPAKEKGL